MQRPTTHIRTTIGLAYNTMKKVYTAHQIYSLKIMYWIHSYKAVLKYMRKFEHILKPIRTGSTSGRRYYVPEENLNEFIRMFETNELKGIHKSKLGLCEEVYDIGHNT